MWFRVARFHGSYLVGVVTTMLLVLYLNTTLRTLQQHKKLRVTDKHVQIALREEPVTEDQSELAKYIRESEAENSERLWRIQEVCHHNNLGLYKHSPEKSKYIHPPTPHYNVFYIDREHKLTWCPLYKAASSTWLYNMCLLGGYTDEYLQESKRQLSDMARELFPELERTEAEEAFHNTLKLLVVRHPFERLLSAYRDKLENINIGAEHGTGHFYQKYGSRIVQKYRSGGNRTQTQSLLNPEQYLWDPRQPQPKGIEPTFKEFVRYLLNVDIVDHSDDHWIPYYLYCTPCLLKYDIIAKVETMLRDQVYVIKVAGLQGLIRPRWRHKTYHEKGEDIANRYFSQLSREEVQKLYELYKLDFELFDYKHEKYLDYAGT
ncbi:hypothetical protein L9F63_019321 [Diploptera punctata]|uniref:Carbohydrate sulfotransferase n=1 Tax=Diploptera punctata TaxID=6984 RepID=A0AAD8EE52_DIPPU|nr:hypothetical protein L9F63_019321 [Diploptera punctata]